MGWMSFPSREPQLLDNSWGLGHAPLASCFSSSALALRRWRMPQWQCTYDLHREAEDSWPTSSTSTLSVLWRLRGGLDPPYNVMVFEYMKHGDLNKFLRYRRCREPGGVGPIWAGGWGQKFLRVTKGFWSFLEPPILVTTPMPATEKEPVFPLPCLLFLNQQTLLMYTNDSTPSTHLLSVTY